MEGFLRLYILNWLRCLIICFFVVIFVIVCLIIFKGNVVKIE